MALPLLALAAISAAPAIIEGGAQMLGSRMGKKDREARLAAAQAEFEKSRQQFAEQDITNVYEDITVNTQQADFQAEQARQTGADTMAGLRAAAGGSGIASLATAIAANQANTAQKISGQIGEQEAKAQQLIASGELERQKRESDLRATLLGMDQAELAASQMDIQRAQQQFQQGLGQMAGGVGQGTSAFLAGKYGRKAGMEDDDLLRLIP